MTKNLPTKRKKRKKKPSTNILMGPQKPYIWLRSRKRKKEMLLGNNKVQPDPSPFGAKHYFQQVKGTFNPLSEETFGGRGRGCGHTWCHQRPAFGENLREGGCFVGGEKDRPPGIPFSWSRVVRDAGPDSPLPSAQPNPRDP